MEHLTFFLLLDRPVGFQHHPSDLLPQRSTWREELSPKDDECAASLRVLRRVPVATKDRVGLVRRLVSSDYQEATSSFVSGFWVNEE